MCAGSAVAPPRAPAPAPQYGCPPVALAGLSDVRTDRNAYLVMYQAWTMHTGWLAAGPKA